MHIESMRCTAQPAATLQSCLFHSASCSVLCAASMHGAVCEMEFAGCLVFPCTDAWYRGTQVVPFMAVVNQYGQPYFPAYPMVMPGAQQQVTSLRALCKSTGTSAFNISE